MKSIDNHKKLDMMKKRILTVVVALFVAVVPAMSQVFITDEEAWESDRAAKGPEAITVMIPEQNIKYDQFIPVGDGLLLLAGMGAAYLLGKRKKND